MQEPSYLICGICEETVAFNDSFDLHSCLEKYSGVFIVEETNYFYPKSGK